MPRKTEVEWWNMLYKNYLHNIKALGKWEEMKNPKSFDEFKNSYIGRNPYQNEATQSHLERQEDSTAVYMEE